METRKEYITVNELAVKLGVSRPMAYKLIHAEGFPMMKLGKKVLIPLDGLDSWIKARMHEQERR